jgi:NSS family neurotransmitter:Na+ symporter
VSSENSVHWSSRFAFLMAAMGSAVGLANIWRFPYTAGVSGGGAFVFIYIGAVLLLALPILIAELMIGRRGAAPPPRAISEVAIESGRSKSWGWVGIILGGIGAILTLSFYSIVGGWTLAYILKMGSGTMQGISADAAASAFQSLNDDPVTLFIWFSVFISVTIFVSARGIKAGVERVVKVMMPSLLVLLVLMVIYAMFVGDYLTMEGQGSNADHQMIADMGFEVDF